VKSASTCVGFFIFSAILNLLRRIKMAGIPKLSVRLSDSYKAALSEITTTIENFRALDELYDAYSVEMTIRTACMVDDEDIFPEDYEFDLDPESLYLNISDLHSLQSCKPSVLSLLEYAFKDSDLKLWLYITDDDKTFVFVQAPLSHLAENARHY
jgi:hypothetical protein